jgi:hypothetical protein
VDGAAVHAFMRRMPAPNTNSSDCVHANSSDCVHAYPAVAYHRVDGAYDAAIHPERVQPSTLRAIHQTDVAPSPLHSSSYVVNFLALSIIV